MLVGQREADRDRQAAGDDRVAAVEARDGVEEVHRAAATAAAAFLLAVHLGHDRAGRDAAHERVAMLAVGRDERRRRELSACITPTATASSPM